MGIAITEPNGKILRANHALQTMLGYEEVTLRLMSLSELMTGSAPAEGHDPQSGLELSLRHADGQILWVSLSVSVIPASDRSPALASAVIVDISARRRAIEDWRRGQAEVARATRLTTMGVLAASIAHEVNQPLSGVVTNGSGCRSLAAGRPAGPRRGARRLVAHRARRQSRRRDHPLDPQCARPCR